MAYAPTGAKGIYIYINNCLYLLEEIFGIWFYDVEECKRLASLLTM